MRFLTPALAIALAVCGEPPRELAAVGPACAALAGASRRAGACDPALAGLAERIAREADERSCIQAVRELVAVPQAARPSESLYAMDDGASHQPLSAHELAALAALERPASLTVVPDLPARPGTPPTQAWIEDVALEVDERGRLRAKLLPGRHALEVAHAGERRRYCVSLDRCEALTLTAHGHALASHPRVAPGPCGAVGSTTSQTTRTR